MARKKARHRKKSRSGFKAKLFRLCFVIVLILIVALAGYCVYLDYQIRDFFDSGGQSQPSHVYARSITFFPGDHVSPSALTRLLLRKGYQEVQQIKKPGQFAASNHLIDIFFHSKRGDDGQANAIRVAFSGSTIQSLVSHISGTAVNAIQFQPELIGSLQLGQYEDRILYELHNVPPEFLTALLAMEDRSFTRHFGIDPKGVLRAAWNNLWQSGNLQGGSTLTQQLVKNIFLTRDRRFTRKLKEALMALIIEARYDKDQILTWYINEIYLGQAGNRAIHGFGRASQFYFGRPLHELDLHETALLIGIIPAPSNYNPIRYPKRALARRNLVLQKMVEIGAIDHQQAVDFSKQTLSIKSKALANSDRYPAFFDYISRQLQQYYSKQQLREGGLSLYSTIDATIQHLAQSALTDTLAQLEIEKKLDTNLLQGAVVIVDRNNGDILAMVGDRVAKYSGFNRAIDAVRPVGSLIKPPIYLSALMQPNQYSLVTPLQDRPLTLTPKGGQPWSPKNYDRKFRGDVPLYRALSQSLNVPTVNLGLSLTLQNIENTLQKLGLKRDVNLSPAALLGSIELSPLEVAQLYLPMANQGIQHPLRGLYQVNENNQPALIFRATPERVIDSTSIYLVNFALQHVVNYGTARRIRQTINRDIRLAGKTGTTNENRDSWFVGYDNRYLMVVWIGNDNNKPVSLTGSSGALKVFIETMKQLQLHSIDHPRPNEIKYVTVDPNTGLLANEKCDNRASIPFHRNYTPEQFSPCSGMLAQFKNWVNDTVKEPTEPRSPSGRPGVTIEDRSR